MPRSLERLVSTLVALLDISEDANETAAFFKGCDSMMGVQIPAAWTNANVGFKVSTAQGGAYTPLYDSTNTLVQVVVGTSTSRGYTCPAEVAPWPWVKLWSQNGSAVDADQAADRSINVTIMG